MSEPTGNVSLPEIIAVMVHDLNNPIAALGTNLRFLETLVKPSTSPDIAETMADMRLLCDTLQRLVSNLGMIGQAELPAARKVPLDVLTLTTGAVGRLESHAETSELKLSFDSKFRTGEVFVQSDPVLCERALDNLLSFALERAVRRSTIVVTIVKAEQIGVRISCTTRPETTETSAHSSRSRHIQSTYGRGLSLYSARLAAQATGSRIDLQRDAQTLMTLMLVLGGDDKQIA